MWKYTKNAIGNILWGVAAGSLSALFLSWVPSLQAKMIHGIIQEPSFPVEVVLSYLIYKGVGNILTGVRVGIVSYAIAETTGEVKSLAVVKSRYLPYDYFVKHSFHDTIELVNNEMEYSVEGFTSLINYTLRTGMQLTFTLCILMKRSIPLALLSVLCSIIHIFVQTEFSNRFYIPSIGPIQENKEKQANLVRDLYEKLEIYRTYAKEMEVYSSWEKIQTDIMKCRYVESFTFGSMIALNYTSGALMVGLFSYLGKGMIDRETLHEFIVYMLSIIQLLEQTVDVIRDTEKRKIKTKKAEKFMNTEDVFEWGFKVSERPLLSLNGVYFGYNDDDIFIKNMNIKVPHGRKLGLYGMSGAGKSTVLKLMMGLYLPTDGEICLNSMPLMEHDKEWYYTKCMCYVPQSPVLFKDEPIAEHPLTEDIPRSGPLSGGQQQRAALAYALNRKPQILFLDEPTCHQDPKNTEKIIRILKEFKGSIVVISHDHGFLKQFCDITKQISRKN